jgi:proline iminopeptidase
MECFETFFKERGFEFYEYDQLGSYSDQPKDSSLWTTERFVEEVEQVRKPLAQIVLTCDRQFMGRYSREYALKYKKNLKGLVIGNMMASGKNMEPMPMSVS